MKQYSSEFKNQLIKEAGETGNVCMVARKHGVSAPTIYSWIRQSKRPLEGDGTRARLKELEKRLESSQLENEILKELLKKTNLAWLGGSQSPESSLKGGGTR